MIPEGIRSVGCMRDGYAFVSDSQDVAPIKEYVGLDAQEFDSFFVLIGEGDYDEVWGVHSAVPYTGRLAFRLR